MGHSSASPEDYAARNAFRSSTADPSLKSFAYTTATASAAYADRKVHENLDPKRLNAAGDKVRECRASAEHPNALGVVIGFDETGSMGDVPRTLQQKLPAVYGATMRAGLPDLQFSFSAYGDAQSGGGYEVAPCQAAQFESGLEAEDALNNIYIEGNGGGNNGETSGLLMYFFARHSRLSSLEDQGKRGIFILIGDELPLPLITRAEVKKFIDDDLQGNLTIEEVVAELQNSYDTYMFLIDNGAARSQGSQKRWVELLGLDHVQVVQQVDTIAEQIAMLIGRLEGAFDSVDDAVNTLVAAGADADAARRAGSDLAVFDRAVGSVTPAVATGNLPVSGSDAGATRL